MAKFRFPGKALKLNTRKRVRFRGSPAAHTPEELYTRRIRKGLDLFTQIFGDSDEVSCPPPATWRQLQPMQSIACNIIPSWLTLRAPVACPAPWGVQGVVGVPGGVGGLEAEGGMGATSHTSLRQ